MPTAALKFEPEGDNYGVRSVFPRHLFGGGVPHHAENLRSGDGAESIDPI